MRRLLVVCIISSILFLGCADDPVSSSNLGSISGTVTDAESDAPVKNASVSTMPATESVVTDSLGQFEFTELEAGDYTIRVSHSLYETSSMRVEVTEGEETEADISLSSSNLSPYTPENPEPVNGAVEQPTTITLSWEASDPNSSDTLVYDLYFGRSGASVELLEEGLSDTFYTVKDLKFNTTYNWQIAARDNDDGETYGPVWNFKTKPIPGSTVVYAAKNEGQYDIYLSTIDSTTVARLTDDPALDWWPRISPNRHKIAFVSRREIAAHIYVMDMDGYHKTRITQKPIKGYHNHGLGFCWSPQGEYLLYSHYDKLYRIDDDGQNRTLIAEAPENRHFRECSWSPDGDKLAVITQGEEYYETELYTLDASGSNMTIVADDTAGILRHPVFSPDGNKLAYVYDYSNYEGPSEKILDGNIIVRNLTDTTRKNLSLNKEDGTNDLFPVWAPHGGKVLFVNQLSDKSTPPDLYIMDIDGEDREKVISNGIMPDWQ